MGCSKSNPLLGKWKYDKEASSPGTAIMQGMMGNGEIEFLPEIVMVGGQGMKVTYEFKDDHVLLVPAQGQVMKWIIVSENEIRSDLPMNLKVVYRRIE